MVQRRRGALVNGCPLYIDRFPTRANAVVADITVTIIGIVYSVKRGWFVVRDNSRDFVKNGARVVVASRTGRLRFPMMIVARAAIPHI